MDIFISFASEIKNKTNNLLILIMEEIAKTDKEALTVKEAAEYLGLSGASLRGMMYRKEIPYYKTCRKRVYFDINDLRKYAFGTRIETKAELAAKAEIAALNK